MRATKAVWVQLLDMYTCGIQAIKACLSHLKTASPSLLLSSALCVKMRDPLFTLHIVLWNDALIGSGQP